jgi:hypothetical protein
MFYIYIFFLKRYMFYICKQSIALEPSASLIVAFFALMVLKVLRLIFMFLMFL